MSIEERFGRVARAIVAQWFSRNPIDATYSGVHEHDGALPDVTAAGFAASAGWLRDTIAALDEDFGAPGALPAEPEDSVRAGTDRPRLDFAVLRTALEGRLVDVGEEERWRTDPDLYHSIASGAVYPLLVRSFASAPDRLRTATRRMEGIPAVLDAGRANLGAPPELATRVAMEQADGSIRFFRDTVRGFIVAAGADAALAARAEAARARALRALEDHRGFLENELLPRSTGTIPLGRARFVRRIAATEGITATPEEIRARAEREIAALRGRAETIARRIAPHQSPTITMTKLSEQHPTGEGLMEAYRSRQAELRRFLRERDLVGLPVEWDVLELIETPPFLRSMYVAACDSPGLFEQGDRTTYFWVTPVDPRASAEAREEYLRAHSTGSIDMISIHEAYPGHHVHGIHARTNPSVVRKAFWSNAFGEGWAHYTEQMMLDEGFGAGNDRLALAQLHEALLRAVRMLVDVAIHVDGMTVDQAQGAFMRSAYMERAPAEMEAKRAALHPGTVLIYTWGKLEILAVREAVHAREGAAFTLRSFHDRLIDAGAPPIGLVGREVFGL
jgi:uncharacterized protein (DUF885 family)